MDKMIAGLLYLLVGSYGDADSECLTLYQFNIESGEAEFVKGLSGIAEPSYQVVMPEPESGRVIYSVSEVNDSEAKLCAYRLMIEEDSIVPIEKVGKDDDNPLVELTLINEQKTLGGSPCYIWVNDGRTLAATANYGGANISIFPIAAATSLLPPQIIEYEGGYPDSRRQSYPHPHCIYSSPDGKYLYVNDLGSDKTYKYEICASKNEAKGGNFDVMVSEGKPAYLQFEKGEGPRHTIFHPGGEWAYTIGELSGMVTVFKYDSESGDLIKIQHIEADPLHAAGSGDIRVSPNGRFLYASNRLQGDGIAIFSVNPESGMLSKVGYQPTAIHPRNFIISPNGKFLLCACRDSNMIQVFEIDPLTGLLRNTGKDIALSKPVCLNLF